MKLIGAILGTLMAMQVATTPVDVQEEPYLEYIGTYTITAYNYYEGDGENFSTAGGYEPIPYWTCATTEDIPMGTILYIEDFGEVQVQDRGAFPSNIIDLHIGYDSIESFDMREREVYRVVY